MRRTLVIIDIQNDYFSAGAYPLPGAEAAVRRARAVLDAFRDRGETIVHVQHLWEGEDAPFLRPGTTGVEIHAAVQPLPDEAVIEKSTPNALLADGFLEALEGGSTEVVMLGMMTSMCVDSTVRAAADAGYSLTLVHDACAAPDITFGGTRVPGDVVHSVFAAALGEGFAELRASHEVVSSMRGE